MAAISPPQSARGLAQGADSKSWGHEKNKKSEDRPQNFSYPQAYSRPQSPAAAEEFTTPTSTLFPSSDAADLNAYFSKPGSYAPSSSSNKPLSDLPVNTLDNTTRSHFSGEHNRNGSDFEGVTDRHSRQRSKAYPPLGSPKSRKMSADSSSFLSKGSDPSKWIHREKLTQIEINEYLALGKEPPPELLEQFRESERREKAESRTGRNRSYDAEQSRRWAELEERRAYEEEVSRSGYAPEAEEPQQRGYSTQEDYPAVSDDDNGEEFVPFDPRTPEEIAAEEYDEGLNDIYHHSSGLRSSSSRIPLSKSSPLPVPQQHLDRSAPLPRKRGTSGNWDGEDAIMYPGARSRSQSIGSQVLLDDAPDLDSSPSSPSKTQKQTQQNTNTNSLSKTASATGGPAARKPSSNTRNASSHRPRQPSSSQTRGSPATGRPSTRDGPTALRPSTSNAHRPEGDPPWLATMYKPDPRLPPDQQVIPTHAKRMLQEQWEKDGKSGSAFDREFQPVSVYPEIMPKDPYQAQVQAQQAGETEDEGAAAAAAAASPPLQKKGSRTASQPPLSPNLPKSPGATSNAGYSTIPKVVQQNQNNNNSNAPQRDLRDSTTAPGQGMIAAPGKGKTQGLEMVGGGGGGGGGGRAQGGGLSNSNNSNRPEQMQILVQTDIEGGHRSGAAADGLEEEEKGRKKGKEAGCGGCCVVM